MVKTSDITGQHYLLRARFVHLVLIDIQRRRKEQVDKNAIIHGPAPFAPSLVKSVERGVTGKIQSLTHFSAVKKAVWRYE